MEKVIKILGKKTLSGDDVLKICHNRANLYVYHNLYHYTSLDQLFGGKNAIIILYERELNNGHWTCVIRFEDHVEFFDPYGNKVDTEFSWWGGSDFKALHEDKKYLKNLLETYHLPYICNKFDFQDKRIDHNECGRHTGFRCLMQEFTIDQYVKLFKSLKGYDYDFWITALTFII